MGKRKNSLLPLSLRWAIWTVYGMKCFKCRKAIDFEHCEITKLIPDSLSKIVLQSIVKEHELGSEFNVNENQNLLPACRSCHKQGKSPAAFKQLQLKSFFELIRSKLPQVEAKMRLIDGDSSKEGVLKELLEKAERGEIKPEDVEKLKSFLESVEGKPRAAIELRINDSVRFNYSSEGALRLQPLSEIRYQKFVEGMVESGDWKRKSPEQIRDGERFHEGRRPKGGGA